MHRKTFLIGALVACFALSPIIPDIAASDWTGCYARIDRVVLEPNTSAPERIQIWGAFAFASKENRNDYEAPQRGYLYFSLKPGKEDVCRKEWADLKAIAGTGEIIGFGNRNELGRLRKAGDTPADPDQYALGFGLVKMSNRGSNYEPIQALRSLPREPK